MTRQLLLCLLTAPLWGQVPAPMSLTLSQARQLALQNNPQVSSAQFNAAAARQVPLQLRAGNEPTFIGSVTGVGADSGSRLAAGGLNNPAVFNRMAAGLTATQLLVDFGRTRSLIESSNLRAQSQNEFTEATQADVLIATIRAYYGVLRAGALLTVARQTVTARQLVVDQTAALVNSQLKSQLDLSFANVNLADAQLLLSQAQNDVKSAEATLAEAIGVPAQTAFTLAEEAVPGPVADQIQPLLQQAVQDRPELKALRLEQAAAEQFVKAEHALLYPSVSAAGSVGVVPAGDAALPGRYGAVGVNLNIPVFNGGVFRARQSEAELRARAAAARIRDLENRISRDVSVVYLSAQTAYDRVGLTSQLLQQAQQALDLAQGRYDLGLGSIVELSQGQLNLTSAQIASASAKYDYQTQRAVLDYQVGALR